LSSFTAHDYRDYYRYTETWSETDIVYEVEVRRRRTVRQLRRLASMIPGRRLLDIGAGPGYFCRIALDEGWDAEGVEISARAVEIGRDRLGVSYIDLEAVPAASVDVVCCRHVVEHVADPLGLLRALRRVLKPGGVLVVHAPHREPLSFVLRNRLLHRPDTLCALYLPDHVLGFTGSSLARVAKRAGFDALSVETRSEHVADPLGLLRALRRVLKPGGVLVVHAPHREPLSFVLRNRLLHRPDTLCALYLPDHVLGFTGSSLARVAKRAGFDALSVETTGKWSAYSDPFFLRHHIRQRTFLTLSRHVTRQLVDSVGVWLGQGDWLVGHLRKSPD